MRYCHNIEIEATNFCNANCVFCANSSQKRSLGYMNVEKFSLFLDRLQPIVRNNLLFKMGGGFPIFTICGFGEPLLHPSIDQIVKLVKQFGFYVRLVTNGSLLDEVMAKKLCKSAVDQICISLHSVNAENYKAITKLILSKTIKHLNAAIPILQKSKVSIMFWRIHHTSEVYRDSPLDNKRFNETVENWGLLPNSILGPSEPWTRAGFVPDSLCDNVHDNPFWCNKILLNYTVDYEGNVILCCNDYSDRTAILGNIFQGDLVSTIDAITREKVAFITRQKRSRICNDCRRWPDIDIHMALKRAGIGLKPFYNLICNEIKNHEGDCDEKKN